MENGKKATSFYAKKGDFIIFLSGEWLTDCIIEYGKYRADTGI